VSKTPLTPPPAKKRGRPKRSKKKKKRKKPRKKKKRGRRGLFEVFEKGTKVYTKIDPYRKTIIVTKYKNNSENLTDILSDIFVLASNQVIHPPSVKKKYKFYKLRNEYGDR